ncbi:hypothetical protein COCCADRAFT_41301 [Bipolaris zeicola 26-R-13]|uniref:RTA1 like protein n=1 Tax=Cochliobolus carbonum (strain 26-R-13) TaxID=930089 RepID=W6YAE8_COCC2|nr:uncharacterized protein COCCADRAFT_41301 [Bipolaris zeicola 26-R-13]EUC28131.1 hypothetical protein COCCADRAFT_41301 [Bipolaris zeicola 26-R-13]
MAEETVDFKLYRYNPSMAAAVIFIILFFLVTTLHFYQMMRTRTWISIPFVLGGIFGRSLLTLDYPPSGCAPALFAASIYMMLGRIILVTDGESHSLIPKKWLTKLLGAGGGIMASGSIESIHTREKIINAGLVVQHLFFSFFITACVIFHARLVQQPTSQVYSQSLPWERQLYALYVASLLILVRCIFRLTEYAQGNSGYLISHEVFLYVFDAVLIFATMVWMAWVHPSDIAALLSKGQGRAVRRVVSVYSLH